MRVHSREKHGLCCHHSQALTAAVENRDAMATPILLSEHYSHSKYHFKKIKHASDGSFKLYYTIPVPSNALLVLHHQPQEIDSL